MALSTARIERRSNSPSSTSAGCWRPVESPEIAGFVAALEPINRLADASPGFVWRLQTDAGDATSIRPTEDDLFLINMSVWTSIEALRAFTYDTAHVEVLRRRREWFERLATAHLVALVGAGRAHPDVDEALDRLDHLRQRRPDAGRVHVPDAVRARGGRTRRPARRRGVLLAGSRGRLSPRRTHASGPAARAARGRRARGSRSGPSRRARPRGG